MAPPSSPSPVLPSVTVCLPAYNEEATVERAVRLVAGYLEQHALDSEILVCDDASTDQTGAIIERLAAEIPHLRVIRHARNRGIRDTFEELYACAAKETIVLLPTDLEWPVDVLGPLLEMARDADIVVAARVQKHYGLFRTVISGLFNWVPVILFGVSTHDAGAVKLVRRELVHAFPIRSRSPFSEAERIIRAARLGYRVAAHPTRTAPRKQGKSHGVRPRSLALSLVDVIALFLEIRLGIGAAEKRGPGGTGCARR